jgi:hypothetical protein
MDALLHSGLFGAPPDHVQAVLPLVGIEVGLRDQAEAVGVNRNRAPLEQLKAGLLD